MVAVPTTLVERLASVSLSEGCSWSRALLDLPNEVIAHIFLHTSYKELRALALTCKRLNSLVLRYGWEAYLAANARPSLGFSCLSEQWDSRQQARYNVQVDRNWRNRTFITRPLCQAWPRSFMSKLAVLRQHLIVNAGPAVDIFQFTSTQAGEHAPNINFRRKEYLQQSMAPSDVTSVAPILVDQEQDSIAFGFADGLISLAHIDESNRLVPGRTFEKEDAAIESLTASRNLLFALTIDGKGVLRNLCNSESTVLWVDGKGRSSYMEPSSASFVAVGATSPTRPLSLYPIREDGLEQKPLAAVIDPRRKGSPVYGITGAPPQFPCNPGQVFLTGSFDGYVRLYDLRTPASSPSSTLGHKSLPSLRPVLRLHDPLTDNESIYSVSSGGGSGYTVGAGLSRHSLVAFWDLRSTRSSWSIYAPGNDPSPVFSLCLESSRVYGSTQSRAFVLDFSPRDSVSKQTYPPVITDATRTNRSRRIADRPLKWSDDLSCTVTSYSHRDPLSRRS